jgi:hypothetical protein
LISAISVALLCLEIDVACSCLIFEPSISFEKKYPLAADVCVQVKIGDDGIG